MSATRHPLDGVERLRGAAEVRRLSERLYGADVTVAGGVVHVAAVWRPPGGGHRVLRILPHTPKSGTDFFVLNLARARADAIVTTGRILREEPELEHGLAGPGAGLLASFREEMGKEGPPDLLVITSGRDLDLDHPALCGDLGVVIYTGEDGGRRLAGRVGAGVEVVSEERPSLRGAIEVLRAREAETIAIEAGPSTALRLYEPPVAVDELMLSVFEGETVPESVIGGEFPDLAELRGLFGKCSAGFEVLEGSGVWRFFRLTRARVETEPDPGGSSGRVW